jgi:hypothetical protein
VSAAFDGHGKSWRKASAGPAAGRGASIANALEGRERPTSLAEGSADDLVGFESASALAKTPFSDAMKLARRRADLPANAGPCVTGALRSAPLGM